MQVGALYIATDEQYVNQALQSAKSLKNISDIPISIVTTNSIAEEKELQIIDTVIKVQSPFNDLRDKVYNIHRTPYEKTLFLDSDTLIIDDISPLFELLNRVDIAAAHARHRIPVTIPEIPNSFPEFNTGVMAYNSNKATKDLFTMWQNLTENQVKHGRPHSEFPYASEANCLEEATRFGKPYDQPTFREALYKSDIHFGVLPTEYNFVRGGGNFVSDTVKILHPPDRKLASKINQTISKRVVMNKKIHMLDSGEVMRYRGIPVVDWFIKNTPIMPLVKRIGLLEYLESVYRKLE